MELYLHSPNTSSWHGTWLSTGITLPLQLMKKVASTTYHEIKAIVFDVMKIHLATKFFHVYRWTETIVPIFANIKLKPNIKCNNPEIQTACTLLVFILLCFSNVYCGVHNNVVGVCKTGHSLSDVLIHLCMVSYPRGPQLESSLP
jgi:hypothetical protein